MTIDDDAEGVGFVARRRKESLQAAQAQHKEVTAILFDRGDIAWMAGSAIGRAADALVLAQYEFVTCRDLVSSLHWLTVPASEKPSFADCVTYIREAQRGERHWNNVLLSLEGIEPVICDLLRGDFERVAVEYASVLKNEAVFQSTDQRSLRATLTRHMILLSQGRGHEMSEDAYVKPTKIDKGPVFRDIHLLLLSIGAGDAAGFNAQLAKHCLAFRKRKSSRLLHAEWGFGEAAQWCFDALGTAVCRLAHKQGIAVDNPDTRLYPEEFWRLKLDA